MRVPAQKKTEGHIVLFHGQPLAYRRIIGSGQKPCLVFLHEGLGCMAMWKDFPEKLCRETGCPGLLYDRAGYGRSAPALRKRTLHYLHDFALIELPQVLQRLIPERPYILVGHSDGGSIGLLHAAEKPSLLKAVVTEAAHVFVEEETLRGIRNTVRAYEAGDLRGLFRYHGEKTETLFQAWAGIWQDRAFLRWNIEYALAAIETPLLVMQGQEDPYGTAAQVAAIVSQSAGPAETAWMCCGHAPHLEKSAETLERMAVFIAANS